MSCSRANAPRTLLRTSLVCAASAAPFVAAPALAAPPETWPEGSQVSAFDMLLVIALIPLGLALLISVLAYVPAMARGERYTPGLAWRRENEWFGGPKDGLETVDRGDTARDDDAATERGGASARW